MSTRNIHEDQLEDESNYSAKEEGPKRDILGNRRFSVGNDDGLMDDEDEYTSVNIRQDQVPGGSNKAYRPGISKDAYRQTEGAKEDYRQSGSPKEDVDWKTDRDYANARTSAPVKAPVAAPERKREEATLHTDETLGRRAAANFDRFGQPVGFTKPKKPDTNMVWSIICLMVCLPFGLLALIQSVKVDSLYLDGDYDGALKASEKAKAWAKLSFYGWVAMAVFLFIAYAMGS